MLKHNRAKSFFLPIYLIAIFSCQSSSPPPEEAKQAEKPKATSPQDKPGTASLRKFFDIESVQIDFTYSGVFEGKESYYIADWGNTVVIVEDKKEFGNPVKQTSFWKDNQTTIYNHLEKKVWRGKMRTKATEPPAIASVAESQLEMVGYKKMQDEQIAGKTCRVYDNTNINVKYWLWKGIDLKIINRSLGKEGYVREATNVVENAAIPEELLAVPAGYTEN